MFQPVGSPEITQPITTKSDLSGLGRLRPLYETSLVTQPIPT